MEEIKCPKCNSKEIKIDTYDFNDERNCSFAKAECQECHAHFNILFEEDIEAELGDSVDFELKNNIVNNVLKELAKKIFDFYGVINIGSTFAISTGECILVIGIIILFCLITSIVIVQKRSSFIS